MLNESGKLDIHKAPETSVIRSYSKKMISNLSRELTKIQRNLSGIREMHRLPDALVIVDPRREHIAIKEAKRMGISVKLPHINDSDLDFKIEGKGIRFGLTSIKYISNNIASKYMAARPFKSYKELEEFTFTKHRFTKYFIFLSGSIVVATIECIIKI